MFFLTITNPSAVLGLIAIFGGVSSFVEVETHLDAFAMVAAIMGGSFLYWFVVSERISRVRHRSRRLSDGRAVPPEGAIAQSSSTPDDFWAIGVFANGADGQCEAAAAAAVRRGRLLTGTSDRA